MAMHANPRANAGTAAGMFSAVELAAALGKSVQAMHKRLGGVRPTQGKTLAVMQVTGGSQSFNTVNQLRVLGRWMRMLTIPNQSSVPMAFKEFENGRMKPSSLYNRIVDVMQELARFTVMARGRPELVDRYSERVETLEDVHKRVTS